MSETNKSIDNSSLSKYVNHYEKIKNIRKPYVKSYDLTKKINLMLSDINHMVNEKTENMFYEHKKRYDDWELDDDFEWENSFLSEDVSESIKGMIHDKVYETIRDLLLKDIDMRDEYDRLQDELVELQNNIINEDVNQKEG